MTDDEVMTVREVADYLEVKDRTIDRLVANGEMPDFKVGGSGRPKSTEGRPRTQWVRSEEASGRRVNDDGLKPSPGLRRAHYGGNKRATGAR